jgi:hypothetical protein
MSPDQLLVAPTVQAHRLPELRDRDHRLGGPDWQQL